MAWNMAGISRYIRDNLPCKEYCVFDQLFSFPELSFNNTCLQEKHVQQMSRCSLHFTLKRYVSPYRFHLLIRRQLIEKNETRPLHSAEEIP